MTPALRRLALALSFLSLPLAPSASAGTPEQPESVEQLTKYKFVVERVGDGKRMTVVDEEYGRIGKRDEGYVEYKVAKWKGKRIVHLNELVGVKKTRGVGKLLKAELLRRFPKKEIRSSLVLTNEKKLLKEWAKGYPHDKRDTKAEQLRDVVPALGFDGFNYVITPEAKSSGGGAIMLSMTPADIGEDGSITVDDPIALDKILVSTRPEYINKRDRPMSEQEKKAAHRENESDAKKAAKLMEKYAKEVSRDEDVDEDDLLEFLWDLMDDSCGRGGSSGSGWADDCLFTAKGRGYFVMLKKNEVVFNLEDWMEDVAKDYVKDHR